MFNKTLKQAKLTANNYFNTLKQRVIKNEGEIEKLQIFDFSCSFGQSYFGDEDFS